jgi:hypothetical protein
LRRTVNTKTVPLGETILGKLLVFLYLKNLETQVSAVMLRKSPLFLKTHINSVARIQGKPLPAVAIVQWAILN